MNFDFVTPNHILSLYGSISIELSDENGPIYRYRGYYIHKPTCFFQILP